MNTSVISLLFFGFSAFLISILVLLKRWDEISRLWAYLSLFTTIYAISYAYMSNNEVNNESALLAARVGTTSATIIPAIWLYFLHAFLEIKNYKLFWLIFPVGIFLLGVGMTDSFIPSVAPAGNYLHYLMPGPLFHIHTINFFSIVSFGSFLLVRSYLNERDIERKKEILSVGAATISGFIGGGSQFSLVYLRQGGFDLTIFLSLYPFLMAYAMIRHRVLDMEKIADIFQREKLAAIGVLAASVNHEIKNPLYIAQGKMESFLQNLEDGIFQNGDADSAVRETIKTSLQQLRRAGEIMQRLTNFAKPQVENVLPERAPLNEVVENVLELVNSELEAKKIKLSREIDKNLALFGNRRQFEEIFFNLIVNASQAMKDGGELTICAERHNGSVRIEIKDQGPGIPSEQLHKIFEPFYTTKESGTGLGLYVTKQLVERNGGKIRCESSSAGTRFCLEFAE